MTPVQTWTVSPPSRMNWAASLPVSIPPMADRLRPGNLSRIVSAHSLTIRRAIGFTAVQLYPPGTVYPSTVGSGRSVSRSTPITLRIVLMAATPWQPPASAASQRRRCWSRSASAWPTPAPWRRRDPPADLAHDGVVLPHGRPHLPLGQAVGQLKFSSKPATPVACTRSMISTQASLAYSSITDAMTTPSGYLSLSRCSSSIHVWNGRSEISSMFCQPITSLLLVRSRAYRGATLVTLAESRLIVLMMTAPHPSSKALPITFAFVPGGPGPDHERVGELDAVDGGLQGGHGEDRNDQ